MNRQPQPPTTCPPTHHSCCTRVVTNCCHGSPNSSTDDILNKIEKLNVEVQGIKNILKNTNRHKSEDLNTHLPPGVQPGAGQSPTPVGLRACPNSNTVNYVENEEIIGDEVVQVVQNDVSISSIEEFLPEATDDLNFQALTNQQN